MQNFRIFTDHFCNRLFTAVFSHHTPGSLTWAGDRKAVDAILAEIVMPITSPEAYSEAIAIVARADAYASEASKVTTAFDLPAKYAEMQGKYSEKSDEYAIIEPALQFVLDLGNGENDAYTDAQAANTVYNAYASYMTLVDKARSYNTDEANNTIASQAAALKDHYATVEELGAFEAVAVAGIVAKSKHHVVVGVGDGHIALAGDGDVLEGFVDFTDFGLVFRFIWFTCAALVIKKFNALDAALIKGRHEFFRAFGFIKNKDRALAVQHLTYFRRIVIVQISALAAVAEEPIRHTDGKKHDQTHQHASYQNDPCFRKSTIHLLSPMLLPLLYFSSFAAASSSKSPSKASIMPRSQSAASFGSIGSLARTSRPNSFATSSALLGPKI